MGASSAEKMLIFYFRCQFFTHGSACTILFEHGVKIDASLVEKIIFYWKQPRLRFNLKGEGQFFAAYFFDVFTT